ncbi:MAG: hypothetical protein KYX66_06745 [Blastomonas fulva]|uniref:hypothetical protein n=1 Tax=Blastomonas fulva TaxID=1550728 RepID=UPI0024E262A9|nr:hypothetical protein [Blastomonas fulva]MDK2756417.1 hypothetical protein [Blastomonas fulva]
MHAIHDYPVGDDTRQHVADLRLAATGDAQAQLRLSQAARAMVVTGEADEIIASMEGLTYARLAAAQGVPDAIMLAADHCAHLGKTYSDCGAEDSASDWIAQAIGLLEIATDLLPSENAAALMQTVNIAADMSTPDIMALAKFYRAAFIPAFGLAALA